MTALYVIAAFGLLLLTAFALWALWLMVSDRIDEATALPDRPRGRHRRDRP